MIAVILGGPVTYRVDIWGYIIKQKVYKCIKRIYKITQKVKIANYTKVYLPAGWF